MLSHIDSSLSFPGIQQLYPKTDNSLKLSLLKRIYPKENPAQNTKKLTNLSKQRVKALTKAFPAQFAYLEDILKIILGRALAEKDIEALQFVSGPRFYQNDFSQLKDQINILSSNLRKLFIKRELALNSETLYSPAGHEIIQAITITLSDLRDYREKYLSGIMKEIKRYTKIANAWLQAEKNNSVSSWLLATNTLNELSDSKEDPFISLMGYHLSCLKNPAEHIFLRCGLTAIPKELSPYWITPKLLQTLTFARNHHANMLLPRENNEGYLKLNWDEMNQLLAFLVCKSELQQILKNCVQEYINTWNENNWIPWLRILCRPERNIDLIKENGFIEYFISCLYFASALAWDEILFCHSRAADILGAEFKEIEEKVRKKELKTLLNYSDAQEKQLYAKQKSLSAEEIFRLATQTSDYFPTASIVISDQKPKSEFAAYQRRNSSTFFVVDTVGKQKTPCNQIEITKKLSL